MRQRIIDVLLVVLAFEIIVVGLSMMPTRWVNFLYNWQTLLGSVLAVIAAAVSIYFLRAQIQVAEKHEQDRRDALHAASRATLPLKLSQVMDYTIECSVALNQELSYQSDLGRPTGVELPPIPTSAIDSIERAIQASTNPEVRTVLANIARDIQIFTARAERLQIGESGPNRQREIRERLVDLSRIQSNTESLFAYGRRTADGPVFRAGDFAEP